VAVRIAIVTSAENTQGPIHFTRTGAPGRFGNHPFGLRWDNFEVVLVIAFPTLLSRLTRIPIAAA